jgi:hypothetical protein
MTHAKILSTSRLPPLLHAHPRPICHRSSLSQRAATTYLSLSHPLSLPTASQIPSASLYRLKFTAPSQSASRASPGGHYAIAVRRPSRALSRGGARVAQAPTVSPCIVPSTVSGPLPSRIVSPPPASCASDYWTHVRCSLRPPPRVLRLIFVHFAFGSSEL